MKTLNEDIKNVKTEIIDGFIDPIEDCSTREFLTEGSKLIRTKLALLFLKSVEKEYSQNVYKILAAGEIIHNASLLHDDVIDDADSRRNKTTICKRFSNKISILLGDYLLSFAIEKLLEVNNNEIIQIFKNCIKKMCEAEIKQFFLRGKLPQESEYIEICKNKTALLFSAILESCAILSNFDREIAKKIGTDFGIYFQIKNDLNKESRETDYKNKIHTAPDVIGIEKTKILLDNYLEEIRKDIQKLPNNIYIKELEGLVQNYDK